MKARKPRIVIVSDAPTMIGDPEMPAPATRLLKYASGGDTLELGGDDVTVGTGYPLPPDVDFEDPDGTLDRYAVSPSSLVTLFIQEYDV